MSTSFKLLLAFLFLAIVFVLSSCSDYNKVDYNDAEVTFNIKKQSRISPDGATTIYTLVGLSVNYKEVKLKNTNIVISPNSKQNIETESIGDIIIRINEDEGRLGYNIDLWMTDEQISKME